jgi:hypothetical protein
VLAIGGMIYTSARALGWIVSGFAGLRADSSRLALHINAPTALEQHRSATCGAASKNIGPEDSTALLTGTALLQSPRSTLNLRSMMPSTDPVLSFWGKARPLPSEEQNWHPAAYHCLDVGAVCERLLDLNPGVTRAFADAAGVDQAAVQSLLVRLAVLRREPPSLRAACNIKELTREAKMPRPRTHPRFSN